MSAVQKKPLDKSTAIKRFLAQSDSITVVWNWFMILAGKAAEPVLVTSVLYASVKLLPIVHFPRSLMWQCSSPNLWRWISVDLGVCP